MIFSISLFAVGVLLAVCQQALELRKTSPPSRQPARMGGEAGSRRRRCRRCWLAGWLTQDFAGAISLVGWLVGGGVVGMHN